jgi:hypothetical protein
MSRRIQPPAETVENLRVALQVGEVHVYCATCRKTFLDIPYSEFYAESNSFIGQPDRWLIETGLHWVDNPDHNIIQDICTVKSNLSHRWFLKHTKEALSLEQMREGLERQKTLAAAAKL